ncbi:MAG: protein-tyrosine-phosphatase [Cytophagales bacterium]|nr:protein-tyrosine-phosphatase [Cytophagales bacterium]
MKSSILQYIETAKKDFDSISPERKELLSKIAQYVTGKVSAGQNAELIYICTHNSRRSHFGQIWGKVAAEYYRIENVQTYSGGTEATAFNPNAIHAIQKIGFEVTSDKSATNPKYTLHFDEKQTEIVCFSKVYDDEANPKDGFCAVMTCSSADVGCPYVAGAEARIATTYEDPKAFDHTPKQEEMYEMRCKQIATETLYAFSLVKSKLAQ